MDKRKKANETLWHYFRMLARWTGYEELDWDNQAEIEEAVDYIIDVAQTELRKEIDVALKEQGRQPIFEG